MRQKNIKFEIMITNISLLHTISDKIHKKAQDTNIICYIAICLECAKLQNTQKQWIRILGSIRIYESTVYRVFSIIETCHKV